MSILSELIAPKNDADNEVLVRKLLFKNKAKVKKNDELIVLETSKTAIILDAPHDGFVEYLVTEGEELQVGNIAIRIHDSADSINNNSTSIEKQLEDKNKVLSEKAKKFVKSKNELRNIHNRFIKSSDLKNLNTKPEIESLSKTLTTKELDKLNVEKYELSFSKKSEIRALSQSAHKAASSISVDIFAASADRILKESLFVESNSSLPLIVFIVANTLREYPLLNAFCSDENEVLLYRDISLGVAMDIDDGLKVYSIENTDQLSLEEIENKIIFGINAYLEKSLKPEQITNSTFTITDLSSYGVSSIAPIINFNQGAILAVSSINQSNQFTLTLTFDHRITEGKYVSMFLNNVKERFEGFCKINNALIKHSLRCDKCFKSLEEDAKNDGIGLIKIVDKKGNEKHICKVCFNGW